MPGPGEKSLSQHGPPELPLSQDPSPRDCPVLLGVLPLETCPQAPGDRGPIRLGRHGGHSTGICQQNEAFRAIMEYSGLQKGWELWVREENPGPVLPVPPACRLAGHRAGEGTAQQTVGLNMTTNPLAFPQTGGSSLLGL